MYEHDLLGQIAIVTGGGRGIGRAIARELGAANCQVAVMARTQHQLDETVGIVEADGGRAMAWQVDVTEQEQVEAAVREVEKEIGPVTLLVNNAGRNMAMGPIWEADPEMWRKDMDINVYGAFLCTRAVLPGMIGRQFGRIINVASNVGIRPSPYRTSYSCSKAALLRLTDSVAESVIDKGVKVFAVSPGWVWTAMTSRVAEILAKNLPDFPGIPENGVFPPEAVGQLIVELALGRGDLLTGRYFHVRDNLNRLLSSVPEILHQDLYTLRMRGLE